MLDRVLRGDDVHFADAGVVDRIQAVLGIGQLRLSAVDDVFTLRPEDRVVIVAAVKLVEVDEVIAAVNLVFAKSGRDGLPVAARGHVVVGGFSEDRAGAGRITNSKW